MRYVFVDSLSRMSNHMKSYCTHKYRSNVFDFKRDECKWKHVLLFGLLISLSRVVVKREKRRKKSRGLFENTMRFKRRVLGLHRLSLP